MAFSLIDKDNQYGAEAVGSVGYINYLGNVSPYFSNCRDNDYIGSYEECIKYLRDKGCTEIIGKEI